MSKKISTPKTSKKKWVKRVSATSAGTNGPHSVRSSGGAKVAAKATPNANRAPAGASAGVRIGASRRSEAHASVASSGSRGSESIYSVHPSIQLLQHWVANLKDSSGRSVQEWIELVQDKGPRDETARRAWFKREHALGTNTAAWLAERSIGKNTESEDAAVYVRHCPAMVDAMYAGAKGALRPVHDWLVEVGRGLGPDVKVCPCKTIVPLYRTHVFAQIKPATRKRIDLGLALGDPKLIKAPSAKRLIETVGFAKKDRITHRIAITTAADVDAEVVKWMRAAYERDA
ncbi:MAG: hypothetical protein K2X32_11405 [Phycisphaerales bacterium]|nr:hypothetical protein [Phycisphaerales bacterium]